MTTEEWAKITKKNPAAFGLEAGYKDMGRIHNEWIRSFLYKTGDLTLLAHRGSFKTTSVIIAASLALIINPGEKILFMRKTDQDVKEVLRGISKMIQSDMVRVLAYDLYHRDLTLSEESASVLSTNLMIGPSGTPQLTGIGIKGSITGKHFDRIFTDDIVNLQDRISRAEREYTKYIYQELQNVKNRGGRIINTGTPWHKDDCFSIMPEAEKFDCYRTGLIKKAQLEKIRKSMTPSLFAANYELKHIADEDQLFDTPSFYHGPIEDIFGGIGHIDAGYGGADSTAYTNGNILPDGTILLFGKLWPKHVDEVLDEILRTHEELRGGSISTEKNADKGYLCQKIHARGVPARLYHEKMNKFIKIMTHLRGNWSRVKFLDGTDPEYVSEILDFTEHAEHDDAPDSAASTIRQLTGGPKVKLFKSLF